VLRRSKLRISNIRSIYQKNERPNRVRARPLRGSDANNPLSLQGRVSTGVGRPVPRGDRRVWWGTSAASQSPAKLPRLRGPGLQRGNAERPERPGAQQQRVPTALMREGIVARRRGNSSLKPGMAAATSGLIGVVPMRLTPW